MARRACLCGKARCSQLMQDLWEVKPERCMWLRLPTYTAERIGAARVDSKQREVILTHLGPVTRQKANDEAYASRTIHYYAATHGHPTCTRWRRLRPAGR